MNVSTLVNVLAEYGVTPPVTKKPTHSSACSGVRLPWTTRLPVMWKVIELGSKSSGPCVQLPSMLSWHVQPVPPGKWFSSASWQSALLPDVSVPFPKSHHPQNPSWTPVPGQTNVPL